MVNRLTSHFFFWKVKLAFSEESVYNVRDNLHNEHSELDLSFISAQVPMICNFLFHKKFKRNEDNQLDIDPDVEVIFL